MSKLTTVGDRVKIKHKTKELVGVVKFVGSVKGKTGVWYGVELETANSGDNNGVVQSMKYFSTSRRKGVFVKKSAILKTNHKNNTAPRVSPGNSSKVKLTKLDCEGIVRFIGEVENKSGIWFGVEIKTPKGTNNGKINGREYFQCRYKYGVFVKSSGFQIIVPKEPAFIIVSKKKKEELEDPVTSNNVNNNMNHNMNNSSVSQEPQQSALEYDTNRRRDIAKVVNVLDESAAYSDLDAVIHSYDDKKEPQDIEWLKIIATLKNIHDVHKKKETQISALETQVSTLKEKGNNGDNSNNGMSSSQFERRLKFEKDELRQKYESQLKTVILEKQRLQKAISAEALEKLNESANDDDDKEEENKVDVEKLKREKEQADIIIRAKDEIIKSAKEEITELRKEIATLKAEEEKEELQLDRLSRDYAKQLLEKRVSDQQQNSLSQLTKEDLSQKKTISELLADCSKEDAVDIIHQMGVIKFEYDKRIRKDTYDCDLTNNAVLRRLTNEQREKWIYLLAHCICSDTGAQHIQKLKMSNMGITDKLFPAFMDILIENIDSFKVEEWWLESNTIGNEGMAKLAQFLALTPVTLEIVKMYNNKTNIKTQVINEFLNAIEANDRIQKFTFEWRLTQHRDRVEKQLKKNQDAKRKRRWAGK